MYLESDSKVKILNFVETSDTSYTVTQDVPAGIYYCLYMVTMSLGMGWDLQTGSRLT